ncbi:MAG: TM0996/MTH895 family glutaredoxin-like protein [Coriobacteriia bacterium]|nr:TM0996/MTH895 family glutaredoxin-like protein [Coriobacteriia bacterium]MBN2821764.1 TM0996/MTH895 family glutaredoxin-like protein [Coriobacteriia bacterium]
MRIKILGSGCTKCNMLEKAVLESVKRLGVTAEVEHVTDFQQIMEFGVMTTPALVIDEQVKVSGRVPSASDLDGIISGAKSADSGGCGCGNCCC